MMRITQRLALPGLILLLLLSGCSDSSHNNHRTVAEEVQPQDLCNIPEESIQVSATAANIEFVRTPDACFDNLDGYPFAPNYAEVEGLRYHYVDEGPRDGEVILMLHGQPSWSYLYRKMIPVFAEAGYRAIAVDHIGMGRSDKPVDPRVHQFEQHVAWLKIFINDLGLSDITLFVQDWGSLIGLRIAGDNPELFARIVVANGDLPVIPEGLNPFTAPVFEFDEDGPSTLDFFTNRTPTRPQAFQEWIEFAATAPHLFAADVLNFGSVLELTQAQLDSYNAPYPSRIHRGAIRAFPSMVAGIEMQNAPAYAALGRFERPFMFLAGEHDPNLGSLQNQNKWIEHVPGAIGQLHTRYDAGHFIQEDVGVEMAEHVASFIQANPLNQIWLEPEPEPESEPEKEGPTGFEILQPQADGTFRAWVSPAITADEFAALDLPEGWIKNQPRESGVDGPDASRFLRSPDGLEEGDFLVEEFFSFPWLHVATVVEQAMPLDEDGLLIVTSVRKYHEITYNAGSTLVLLVAPSGDVYFRIGRDADRVSDQPTIPSLWRLVEYTTPEELVIELFAGNFVIRTDNQDSFQGPVPELSGVL
ncbi:MAG: haloalkane dehalogenase [Halioglobus sp.]